MTEPALVLHDRPHQGESTAVIKKALGLISRDARKFATTGPKKQEDALHAVANGLLDELQARGEL